MTSYQEAFERKEVKYRLDAAQRSAMLTALEGRMAVDDYGTTSIVSRYFDTPDRALIERSLDKPLYKEKLRVRSYGIPGEDDQVFVKTLLDFAKRYEGSGKKLLLVPCGDNYIKLLVRNQEKLRGTYVFECISEELLMRLSIKESFYQVCTEHGFAFPKTTTCSYENYKNVELPFDFPVIIKPSNSVAYWNCRFPHKKKVFVAQSREEFSAILEAIYSSSYKDHLILQEYIPGDDSNMRVMNCYCGRDGKVKLIALGNALLEEHSPEGIGSYAAIINGYDEKLNQQMKNFLEGIGYVGFANFDMKYDHRDGTYKLFEMNLRQGRSSYYVTAAGYNLAKYLVEDRIEGKPCELTITKNRHLWWVIPPKVAYDYVNPRYHQEMKALQARNAAVNPLFYSKDNGFLHKLRILKGQRRYVGWYASCMEKVR